MNDKCDLQEVLVADVDHHQWMDKNFDEYRVRWEEGEEEKMYLSRLGRCLLNVR